MFLEVLKRTSFDALVTSLRMSASIKPCTPSLSSPRWCRPAAKYCKAGGKEPRRRGAPFRAQATCYVRGLPGNIGGPSHRLCGISVRLSRALLPPTFCRTDTDFPPFLHPHIAAERIYGAADLSGYASSAIVCSRERQVILTRYDPKKGGLGVVLEVPLPVASGRQLQEKASGAKLTSRRGA